MISAIILSGGTGSRLGADIPKQYLQVKGRTVLSYSLETFTQHPLIDSIVIVAAPEWREDIRKEYEKLGLSKKLIFANPGETRQFSIFNGLRALEETDKNIEKVIIHDGARPLVSSSLISDCLNACSEDFPAVMPVMPVKDTIYVSENGESISGLLDRTTLFAGQAPEVFLFRKYLEAHNTLTKKELLKINGSSELAFKVGMAIRTVKGDPMNFKITDKEDLNRFKSICNES